MIDEIKDVAVPGDGVIGVETHTVELLADAFRPYERHRFTLSDPAAAGLVFDRDVVRAGAVVGVLPVDLARREVVLIRQFRFAAHLATGKGELVEIVAGRVDAGETPRTAALRECHEEIAIAPLRAVQIMSFLIAPAFADELMTLWLAEIDATTLPALAGEVGEGEIIRPVRLPFAVALDLMHRGVVRSGQLLIALQWLALNEGRLAQVLDGAGDDVWASTSA